LESLCASSKVAKLASKVAASVCCRMDTRFVGLIRVTDWDDCAPAVCIRPAVWCKSSVGRHICAAAAVAIVAMAEAGREPSDDVRAGRDILSDVLLGPYYGGPRAAGGGPRAEAGRHPGRPESESGRLSMSGMKAGEGCQCHESLLTLPRHRPLYA
jgi:hypothetical protein